MTVLPPGRQAQPKGRWRTRLEATVLFAGLTAIMTWPQTRLLGTHAAEHFDVFFNLWRLGWIGHALTTSPLRLFDGNIFHPEPGTLAMSDAMLLQGVLTLPLFRAGVPPVLVHNLALLGAIVASGAGMFALARHLSGSRAAAIVAGIVFAFAPYRFEHYMHLELQWTMWIPWSLWAVQRTIETAAPRYGVLAGLFVALQMLSAIYYGMFLALVLVAVAGVQLLALPWRRAGRTLRALALGAALAAAVSALYAIPYRAAADRVGTRQLHDVTMFSARPPDYLVATPANLLYGGVEGNPERRLFPGYLPLALALFGLLAARLSAVAVSYVVGLAMAFELSLGMHGLLYPLLYEHVTVFRGLRAPARAAVFGLAFLGVLAALGCRAVAARAGERTGRRLALLVAGLLLLEYWVAPIHLVRYHNTPPELYGWLARQPRGVVAEFPLPRSRHELSAYESRYAYMSTFHWMPLLNGYSGYHPEPFLQRLDTLATFPDQASLDRLRTDGVRYLIVHTGGYAPEERERVVEGLRAFHLPHLGDFDDGWGDAAVFLLR